MDGVDEKMFSWNNTTLALLFIGVIGLVSTYLGNNELAAVALGSIAGWISKSYNTLNNDGGTNNDP